MDEELSVHQEEWNVMDGPDEEEKSSIVPETVSNSFVDVRKGVLRRKMGCTHDQELGPRHGVLPEDQLQGCRYISKAQLYKSTSQ